MRLVAGYTHWMALLPVVWLGALHLGRHRRGAAWWWLAAAFAVSWVADAAAHVVAPTFVSAVYPVTQCALVAAVFLPREGLRQFVGITVALASAGVLVVGVQQPDAVLRGLAVVPLVLVLLASAPHGALRDALLVYFAGGMLAWIGFTEHPTVEWWSAYQGERLAGLVWFCYAASVRTRSA